MFGWTDESIYQLFYPHNACIHYHIITAGRPHLLHSNLPLFKLILKQGQSPSLGTLAVYYLGFSTLININ